MVFLVAVTCANAQNAPLTVTGVSDRANYYDSVSFSVSSSNGYTYQITLDTNAVPVDTVVQVRSVDYHELYVRRTHTDSGIVSNRLIRFNVRSSERSDTETGLPAWTPFLTIPSTAGEFAEAQLKIIAPAEYPSGLDIPVIAFAEKADGNPVRANGLISAAGHPNLELKRGVGSVLLPAANTPGDLQYGAQIQSLQTNKTIAIESNTTWTTVSGTLSSSVDWGENARIHVGSHLVIPAGVTLTIGAGSVVRIGHSNDFRLSGALIVNGTLDRPVVFTPATRSAPWGGIICRVATANIRMHGAILTGAGADPNWVDNNPGSGSFHKDEHPLIYLQGGATATLTNCYLIHNFGQAGHGENSYLTLDRCLLQRFITGGQYNGGAVTIHRSALIELPADNDTFANADNDGFYLTGAAAGRIHSVTDTLIGWTKDDGIDAGSSSSGSTLLVSNCWFESTYHEAMAWSEDRTVTVKNTVAVNCGQAIECGFSGPLGKPNVFADNCLAIGNATGARFGDNYDWSYLGFLRVTNCLLLYNHRDVWGLTWNTGGSGWDTNRWVERIGQMDVRGNYVVRVNTNHSNNAVWNPATDAARLAPFMTTPPSAPAGIGIAIRASQSSFAAVAAGVPVRLSSFTTHEVSVDYALQNGSQVVGNGTLTFAPGEMVKRIPVPAGALASEQVLRAELNNPVGGEITGKSNQLLVNTAGGTTLVALGSTWKYLDTGTNLGVAWRGTNFNDAAWPSGPAELGYGENDEATPISFGGVATAKYITYYFRHWFPADPSAYVSLLLRLKRDDGAIVYLNSNEVFRSNIPGGTVNYLTPANNSSDDGKQFFTMTASTSALMPGTNLVAVEVHQDAPDSSDVSFDLEIIGQSRPKLVIFPEADGYLLVWTDPTYQLQHAPALNQSAGNWTTIAGATSPHFISGAEAMRVYRLRK